MTGPPGDDVRTALEKAIGFQYDILRLLGRGGMGAVYHAHEKALDRPVAIKVLPPEVAGTTAGRERFLREARTAARLTHPGIVPLFTFGDAAGLIYYVMGYVEGESLQQRLDRAGRLDPAHAAKLLEQVANALEYAHRQGVVHRDVKPDNILIERGSGDAKLTDFGIAKRASAGETLTGTGLVVGTPRYMSPEQASGDKDLDARSDVYALGLVGYAMLTGRPPFEGGSVQETLRQQVMRDAPSLRKMFPDLPSQMVLAVERALEKEPVKRWQSAEALAQALTDEDDSSHGLASAGRRPGVWSMLVGGFTLLFWNIAWATAFQTEGKFLPTLFALYPLAFMGDYFAAKYKEKRSPHELRRMLTEPPRWWPYWWPEKWRRADDIWKRLPPEMREIRLTGALGVGLFLFALESTFLFGTARTQIPLEWREPLAAGMLAAYAGSLLSLGVAAFRSWRWGRRNGVSYEDAAQVTSKSTAQLKFWTKPHIARLLLPVADAPAAAEPKTSEAFVTAIAAAASDLQTHEEVAEATGAARRLVGAIDVLDDEIARLARDIDPAEIVRLEARLASPGNEEMRALYASQLDVLKRLVQQRADFESARSRYVELLRTLWLQVTSLRAQVASDALEAAEVSGKIREICRSVQHEIEAARETAAMITRVERSAK